MIAPKHSCVIAICTHERPQGLRKAIKSVGNLKLPADLEVHLLVVNNSTSLESKKVFENEVKDLPISSEFITEPKRGISYARNAALAYAQRKSQDYLAFFDDDDYPDKNWLVAHWECLKGYTAQVTSGQMVFKWQPDCVLDEEIKRIYDSASGSIRTGSPLKRCGSGNTLMDLDFIFKKNLTFHYDFNLTGGGDAHFFEHLSLEGGKIVHCEEAIVYSDIDPERANEQYIFNRRYKVGYNSFNKDVLLYGKPSAIWISTQRCISILFDISLRFFKKNAKNRAWKRRQLSEAKGRVDSMLGKQFEYYSETDGR